MVFSPPLRSPFITPFSSTEIAAIPWWQVAGKTCIAAYCPLDADSLAASYINLANPGTYDAALGSAPSWSPQAGWLIPPGYLTTGITAGKNWSVLVQVAGMTAGGVFGSDATNDSRFYIWGKVTTSDRVGYGGGGYAFVTPTLVNGNLGVAGNQGYRNGSADGGTLTAYVGNPPQPLLIGGIANASTGALSFGLTGQILNLAIWSSALTSGEVSTVVSAMRALGAYSKIVTTAGGQNVILMIPSNYNAVAGAPLIIYHHGIGEIETSLLTDILKGHCVVALLKAGYIVASSAAGGAYDWGNDAALTAYDDLYDYCVANYNITRVAAWSQSMGGLSGLLSVSAGTIPYKGWLGTYPVCNLRDMYDSSPTYAGQIRTAYGIAGDGSDYDAKTAGHDPVLLSADLFNGVRMRFYASASDTTVSKTNNSDAMSSLVTGHATEYTVVACSGIHGDASHFQPSDYVAFFDRCV